MSENGVLWASIALLWVVVVAQTLVLIELLRQIGILRLRLGDEPGALFVEGEGLERGSSAPAFEGRDVKADHELSHRDLFRDKALLVFLSTRCQSCRELLPAIKEVAETHRKDTQIVVVCSDPSIDGGECAELAQQTNRLVPVIYDRHQTIMRDYGVRRTPSATLIEDSTVRLHAIPNNGEQLESLLDEEVMFSGSVWRFENKPEEVPTATST